MKKGITFLIIFIVIISIFLFQMQNLEVKTLPSGEKIIENIKETEEVNLNEFIKLYKQEKFDKITLKNNTKLKGFQLLGTGTTQKSMLLRESINQKNYNIKEAYKPGDTSLKELGLSLTGTIPLNVKYQEKSVWSTVFFENILPLLFFVFILVMLLKFFGPKSGGFPFNTQAGKLINKATVKTSFKDVVGMQETKEEIEEIVDFLRDPKKYHGVGAKIPKGILLYGPPGNGKTLLARAVAGEAGVPFFSISGSEFMEMLVGMGASKVRDLFNKAKASAPSLVYIDELDAIGKKRGGGNTGGHQEQEQTLNQLLSELDGFDQDTKVIVIATTNRPDILDPALLRPGRFDRKVMTTKPTLEEREKILEYYTKDKNIQNKKDIEIMAKRTTGFVGADLENLVNEAALKIGKENRKKIFLADFEYALEKVLMGPKKKIKTMSEKERKTIAYHELGHAVTAYNLSNADPVEKISIVSRGMALGLTWMLPQEDKYLSSKAKFLDDIVSLLGGRACEEVVFGENEITTGASNDFEKVTKIASDMITKYGMDAELGPIMYFDDKEKERTFFKPYSEKTAQTIDNKISQLIKNSYETSKEIIKNNKEKIEKIAELLLEKEFLNKDEFYELMEKPEKVENMIKKVKEEKEREKKRREREERKQKKQKQRKQHQEKNLDKEKSKDKDSDKKKLNNFLDKFLK